MIGLFSVPSFFVSTLQEIGSFNFSVEKLPPLLLSKKPSFYFSWKYAAPGTLTHSIELVGFKESKFKSLLAFIKKTPPILSIALGGIGLAAVCCGIFFYFSSSQMLFDPVHSLRVFATLGDFKDPFFKETFSLPSLSSPTSFQFPSLVRIPREKIGDFSITPKIEDPLLLPIQWQFNSEDLRGEILRIYQNWKEANPEESTPFTPEEEGRLQTTLYWFETLYPLLPVPSTELGEMFIRILTFDYHSLRPLVRHDDYDFFSQLLDQSRIMILEHLLSLTVFVSSQENTPREIADQLTEQFLTGMESVLPLYHRQVETWVPTVVREANPFLGRPAIIRQVREVGSPLEIDVAHLRRARQARVENLASQLRRESLTPEAVRLIDFLTQPTAL